MFHVRVARTAGRVSCQGGFHLVPQVLFTSGLVLLLQTVSLREVEKSGSVGDVRVREMK